MPYHNPYHFVPVSGQRTGDLPRAEFESGDAPNHRHVNHDRYAEQTFSGRIHCRLVAEGPLFIGDDVEEPRNDQTRTPAKLRAFQIDGKPAIPATSLKGLVSSILEAAANSSLRVLESEALSYRQDMNHAISAIGMVVIENGQYRLRPLTLPNVDVGPNDSPGLSQKTIAYRRMFPRPNFKVYFGNSDSIRNAGFGFETFSEVNEEYFGLRLCRYRWDGNDFARDLPLNWDRRNPSGYYWKPPDQNNHDPNAPDFILGQRAYDSRGWIYDPPDGNQNFTVRPDLDCKRWAEIPEDERYDAHDTANPRRQWVRGILRVFGCDGRQNDVPRGKKHEIFIPYPEEMEAWPTYEIPGDVIDVFEGIADQRTKETEKRDDLRQVLPFHLKGTRRNSSSDPNDKKLRLKDGDLVYFSVDAQSKINRISFSSIWREPVAGRLTSSHDFFRSIDNELPPFGPSSNVVTLADQLFGFVEGEKGRLSLKGRVEFSNALASERANGYYAQEIILKILAGPKPPSPAMYFKNNENTLIRKNQLAPGVHQPQGRKFYLHHHDDHIANEPWRTRRNPAELRQAYKQMNRIQPVKTDTEFEFTIEVENLSNTELGALLYALRPNQAFRHKIGMGKPIGLGKVRIEPLAVLRIDRQARYSVEGLKAARYSSGWFAGSEQNEWFTIEGENTARNQYVGLPPIAGDLAPVDAHGAFRNGIPVSVKNALELLGDPSKTRFEVHYPTVRFNGNEQNQENETYLWFVANDSTRPTIRHGHHNYQPASRGHVLRPITNEIPETPSIDLNG